MFFFFNDTATTEIYTLSLHDALPILPGIDVKSNGSYVVLPPSIHPSGAKYEWNNLSRPKPLPIRFRQDWRQRSEEHTSELQSRQYLVCRLLLEKKKTHTRYGQLYRYK